MDYFKAESGKPSSASHKQPLMLKDFLLEDSHSYGGFASYPRRCDTTVRNLLEMDLKDCGTSTGTKSRSTPKLLRSKSIAASATITTALHRASEAVLKVFRSRTSNRPGEGFLSRSLSRRLRRSFRSKSQKSEGQIVRVRDIMRWKSFTQVESATKSVDFLSSSIQSSSTNSSWTDTDFSLPSSSSSSEYSTGENETVMESKSGVGEDSTGRATCYRKPQVWERLIREEHEEKEQLSPVSVLDFPDEEEDSPFSSFQRNLANMERKKEQLLQKIRRFESLAELAPVDLEKRIALFEQECSSSGGENTEKRIQEVEEESEAREVLELLKSNSGCSVLEQKTEKLLLDFFSEGLGESVKNVSGDVLLRTASDWLNGSDRGTRREVQDDREALVREMEMGGRWWKLKQEEDDLLLELEVGVMGVMIDDLLTDLLYL
ncbi:hypothetical protein H6P81_005957 [Aristolochia fimbriata]|uniref:DUF4378 domain-containing protein n=1 Tax=Aristolochia fimbriata TaxID=158543 RepID=A0AAV7EW45_ARIFI|nr:hypothetical protein H6P81_005957 [Aristolochia fimbriata]